MEDLKSSIKSDDDFGGLSWKDKIIHDVGMRFCREKLAKIPFTKISLIKSKNINLEINTKSWTQ